MNKFTYSNPAKVYFGKGSADDALNAELQKSTAKRLCSLTAAAQLSITEFMMRL